MRKKGLLSTVIGLGLVVVLALALPLSACAPAAPPPAAPAPPKVYTVPITQIVSHPALDVGRQAFYDGMADSGFEEGVNIDYIFRNAQGDMSIAKSIADYFVSLKPDLIVTITTPNSIAMADAIEGTGLNMVFFLVTDPVTAGIVPSWTKSAPHITGFSDWADVPAQIAYIKELMPDLKNLGIIYNAGEVNSVVQVNEVNEVAPGLGLTIVEATAAATADVYAAAQSLVGRVEAMWMPTDNTIFSAVDSVLKVAEENDIPFFGSDTNQCEAGLAAAAGTNIYGIGYVAATDMAAPILRGEATPADIPPMKQPPEEMRFAVNPAAAERMGLTIPQAIIDAADEVYE